VTAEYTETFAKFIISCQREYTRFCERVAAGEVPPHASVKMTLDIPADDVDRIRFDMIAATNGDLDGGIGS